MLAIEEVYPAADPTLRRFQNTRRPLGKGRLNEASGPVALLRSTRRPCERREPYAAALMIGGSGRRRA